MKEEPLVQQSDESAVIAPRSASPFPSGLRLGLEGSIEADDLARRALGKFSEMVLPETPEDMPKPFTRRESFDFKAIDENNYLSIYGGSVRWGGYSSYNLPDDTMTEQPIGGGTEESPHCVALRLEWSLGPAAGTTLQYVSAEFPPQDDGTYGWKPLYAVYLKDDVAVCGRSMRHDWNLVSPI